MTTNVGACAKMKKNIICAKRIIWNPATCTCENGRYAESVTDNSVITCDEIIDAVGKLYAEPIKIVPTKRNLNKKVVTCETKKLLLAFSLITVRLLLVVSIYCCLIKY